MSVQQDRFTFFGVLVAVVIVVVGYLQLSRLYPDPVVGRDVDNAQDAYGDEAEQSGEAPREGEAQP